MSDLLKLSLSEVTTKLKAREVSSVELATEALSAAKAAQPALNAFTAFDVDKTLAMAAASDAKLAAGEGGALEGAPLAIKDLFAVEGVSTTASSNILKGFEPTYESTVTKSLWNAGGVFLAKTSMDEFAMGSSNETANTGPVVNPWKGTTDGNLTPGGSSGGSASALAADLCFGSTGTDTGGSIRQPASFTGTVGVKGTYGRTSRWGVVAFASSLDHPGPFGKTVKDSAMLLQAMSGHDPKDSTSLPNAVPDFVAAVGKSVKGLRIGVPKEYRLDEMPEEIAKVWDQGVQWLKAAGCEIVDISLPHTKYALPAYYIVAPAEASSNLARYDGMRFGVRQDGEDLTSVYENTRAAGFGEEVQRRIMIGTYVLSAGYYDAYYLRAQKVRTRILQDFDNAYQKCDAILTPSAPSSAFGIGTKSDDPIEMYLNDVFTVTANLAGVPAMSVPAGLDSSGLPLGLQIITKALDEETMFSVGAAIEDAAGFNAKPEKWW
ncbi:MAG: Asp-tRNA(Asn)/Glu-tRNA(Gln) amidotransferase subunit GatA [Maricaulis sp.]|jgi:aspartyl-tRNA(Asn)/glutamyl-tRNA(Gln) amidotransferase subunit A|nr:Asp-tRNA(Asn)/Glu-tRNA(Gln) amidotransferase subunit GatA [Maricaulis sp.]MDG2043545.1 Asp-tRNA(Asn)/Glu-tRNA(Gln) amidotransferase subunit GatA [Maricaulis sp.]